MLALIAPKTVVERLNDAAPRIVGQAEVRQLWAEQSAAPMVMAPEALEVYMREDVAKWASVIQRAGSKAD